MCSLVLQQCEHVQETRIPADSLALSQLAADVAEFARLQKEDRKQQEEYMKQQDMMLMELRQQMNRSTQTTQHEIDIGKVRRLFAHCSDLSWRPACTMGQCQLHAEVHTAAD